MVADRFKDRRFVAFTVAVGELDECLDKLRKERVTGESRLVEEDIDFGDVARLPELHQAMRPVYERHRATANAFKPERLALALVPAAQADLAAGAFAFGLITLYGVALVFVPLIGRIGFAARLCEDFEAIS